MGFDEFTFNRILEEEGRIAMEHEGTFDNFLHCGRSGNCLGEAARVRGSIVPNKAGACYKNPGIVDCKWYTACEREYDSLRRAG